MKGFRQAVYVRTCGGRKRLLKKEIGLAARADLTRRPDDSTAWRNPFCSPRAGRTVTIAVVLPETSATYVC